MANHQVFAAADADAEPARGRAASRFAAVSSDVSSEPRRWPAVPLAVAGAACGGFVLAFAALQLSIPSPAAAVTPETATVLRWLLSAIAAAASGLAALAYDRHHALVAARSNERSFRELYNSISEGVFRSTLDGRMISANPALVRLNGYETEEQLTRHCNDIASEWYVDPNRRAEIHQMLLKHGHLTNVVSEVYRHNTRERIWIEESIRLVRDEKTGEPLYYEGNVSEVTETMRRLELQGHYDKIASIMSGCLYQHRERPDGATSIPYASVGLYHLFGVKPEDVVDTTDPLANLIVVEDLERITTSLAHSRDTLNPWQSEYRIVLPDGTEKWLFAHAVPEREADGSTLWHGYIVDVSERKRSEARIYELAYLDSLTQLPNRTSLRERLSTVLARQTDGDVCGALLFVDLDHFKVLNDTKGHHVGDLLLAELANRLRVCVGSDDLVARIGGDEFVVLLCAPSREASDVEARVNSVSSRILAAVDRPFEIDGEHFQTTASIGAVFLSGDGQTVDDVLKRADLAMYEAKAAGRGTLRFFEESMQTAATDRLALTSDLRDAHREGRLALHYQPVVDRNGRCTGAEALLRWHHPTRGLLAAAEFITLAEGSGLMNAISKWVLSTACATLKEWEQDPLMCGLGLGINIGARELSRPDFVDTVQNALAQSGARADLLVVELTEHVMLDDIDVVTEVMSKLQASGVRFVLDDFGTGYSSLSYLKRLAIDALKIDRSFVCDIETDQSDREIVQTIVNIARSLKIPVIAEGVETELQALLLRQLGCDRFQGYLFGRPQPLADFRKHIEKQSAGQTPGRNLLRAAPR